MKIGDRIRYLNAVGGGIITGIGDKGIITVLEEDGFETPVMAREVVVIHETNELNFKIENKVAPAIIDVLQPAVDTKQTKYSFDISEEIPEGEKINLFLAFVPTSIKSLQSSSMELFLVNESNYYISLQMLTGNSSVKVHTSDIIEPQTQLFIEKIDKQEVNNYEFIHFQGFAFKTGKPFDVKPSIDISIRINPVDFYKLHSFEDNDIFDKKAMIISILENDYPPVKLLIDDKQLQNAMQEKKLQPIKKQFIPPPKKEIIEIDLHIHELIENFSNLSSTDILHIQMDKFHSVMNENIRKKGQKIIFIHGKGEGILRKEITEQLKKRYKNASFHDASFQQYGFGATQVNIH